MSTQKKSPQSIVRTIYMYLVCLVAIVTFIIGSVNAVNVTLKYYVFDLKTPRWEQPAEIVCKDQWRHPQKPVTPDGKLEEPLTDEEIAECIEETTLAQQAQGRKDALETLS